MAKFEDNADGSTIVKLDAPIRVGDVDTSRVTIPKLKGRHLFGAPAFTSMGVIVQWADGVVEPRGAVGEMTPEDAVAVGDFLFARLNPSRKDGAADSAVSAATTDGAAASS